MSNQPTTNPPVPVVSQSVIDAINAAIQQYLSDNHLSVAEFQDLILKIQSAGLISDKTWLQTLSNLKVKALADNPNTTDKLKINQAFISAIPIEEANKMVKEEGKKYLILILIMFASFIMTWLLQYLPNPP